MSKTIEQKLADVFGDELKASEAKMLHVVEKRVQKLASTPDRGAHGSILHTSESVPYGSAGRSRPAWEREYETNAHHMSEEERKLRTPKNDLETIAFFKAVIDGDQAKLREIEVAQPRDGYERADLSIGTGGPGLIP
jgi:hypothetical protein